MTIITVMPTTHTHVRTALFCLNMGLWTCCDLSVFCLNEILDLGYV